jgi:hypothetical protein
MPCQDTCGLRSLAMRRMTPLANAHSKKWENHEAPFALYFAYYNFCRVHLTLTENTRSEDRPVRKTTPAMAGQLSPLKQHPSKRSIARKRKEAILDTAFLKEILVGADKLGNGQRVCPGV